MNNLVEDMNPEFKDEESFETGLTSLDYWRLCVELTIIQASLLVSGHDPSSTQAYVEGWEINKRPSGYEGAKAALFRALELKDIEGFYSKQVEYNMNGEPVGHIDGSIDLQASTVNVDSLKLWLRGRGINTGFFFPGNEDAPDYLDPKHPRYSRKLAASVTAWMKMEEGDGLLKGKSVKQSLEKWLRVNAAQYDLCDGEGKPNEKGIEECAKVANWQQKGGAPKTPD
jgi:hypothetical protein